jgi:hypothetical protein
MKKKARIISGSCQILLAQAIRTPSPGYQKRKKRKSGYS